MAQLTATHQDYLVHNSLLAIVVLGAVVKLDESSESRPARVRLWKPSWLRRGSRNQPSNNSEPGRCLVLVEGFQPLKIWMGKLNHRVGVPRCGWVNLLLQPTKIFIAQFICNFHDRSRTILAPPYYWQGKKQRLATHPTNYRLIKNRF